MLTVLNLLSLTHRQRRLNTTSPTLTVNSLLSKNSLNTHKLLSGTRRLTNIRRIVSHTQTRPNGTLKGHHNMRLLIIRMSLIRIHSLRLTTHKKLRHLNMLSSLLIVSMRTNNRMINANLLKLLLSMKSLLNKNIRISSDVKLKILRLVTGRHNTLLTHSNLKRILIGTETMRSTIDRSRHRTITISRILTGRGHLNSTVTTLLNLMLSIRTGLKTVTGIDLMNTRVLQIRSRRGITSVHLRRHNRQMMSRQLIVSKGRILKTQRHRKMRIHTRASNRGSTLRLSRPP